VEGLLCIRRIQNQAVEVRRGAFSVSYIDYLKRLRVTELAACADRGSEPGQQQTATEREREYFVHG
jgi:hypothetical protein